MPASMWQRWLSKLEPEISSRRVTLVAPSEFHLNLVKERYGELLATTNAECFGPDTELILISLAQPLETIDDSVTEVEVRPENVSTMLYKRYRFDQFVLGDSNFSRTGRRWRWQISRASPTTPSLSLAGRASARPTFSMPLAITAARPTG